jgi:putative endonuclease
MNERSTLGRRGEELAVAHLTKAGYRILDRNVRTRYGEIDVVAQDGGCIVFVEVRTFRTDLMTPVESVGRRKQQRVAALSRAYLAEKGKADADWRADVIAITVPAGGAPPVIDHIISAIEET